MTDIGVTTTVAHVAVEVAETTVEVAVPVLLTEVSLESPPVIEVGVTGPPGPQGPQGPIATDRMRWSPRIASGQAFEKNDVTYYRGWSMVANKDTAQEPYPQITGPTDNLLGAWTPTLESGKNAFMVRNTWTLNTSGIVEEYGITVHLGNIGLVHTVALLINGIVMDNISYTPRSTGEVWRKMSPTIVPGGGSVLAVQLSVVPPGSGNPDLFWYEQPGWFAAPPTYCVSATGSKDNGAQTTTAYSPMVLFTPSIMPTDWDVLAYQGSVSASASRALEVRIARMEAEIEKLRNAR